MDTLWKPMETLWISRDIIGEFMTKKLGFCGDLEGFTGEFSGISWLSMAMNDNANRYWIMTSYISATSTISM